MVICLHWYILLLNINQGYLKIKWMIQTNIKQSVPILMKENILCMQLLTSQIIIQFILLNITDIWSSKS